jgi:hypothetical protein
LANNTPRFKELFANLTGRAQESRKLDDREDAKNAGIATNLLDWTDRVFAEQDEYTEAYGDTRKAKKIVFQWVLDPYRAPIVAQHINRISKGHYVMQKDNPDKAKGAENIYCIIRATLGGSDKNLKEEKVIRV